MWLLHVPVLLKTFQANNIYMWKIEKYHYTIEWTSFFLTLEVDFYIHMNPMPVLCNLKGRVQQRQICSHPVPIHTFHTFHASCRLPAHNDGCVGQSAEVLTDSSITFFFFWSGGSSYVTKSGLLFFMREFTKNVNLGNCPGTVF